GQVTHWLFATGDTLAINVFRALALLATHPRQRELAEEDPAHLEACLQEAMRLWPTTPLLSRVALEGATVGGIAVPAGRQVLISNTFNHRDPERADADRFAPEAWTEGDRRHDWSLNHFSPGPQGCPGAPLALYLGGTVLTRLLERGPRLQSPRLDPMQPLPEMLDFFRLRFSFERALPG